MDKLNPPVILTTIPFQGFYNSWHEARFDDGMERLFQDDSGCEFPWSSALVERFSDKTQWQNCFVAYAAKYVEAFAEEIQDFLNEVESLWSPKEYNFSTDRIYVTLSVEDFERVYRLTEAENLASKSAEMFTSRSGFMSYYVPEYQLWDLTISGTTTSSEWSWRLMLTKKRPMTNSARKPKTACAKTFRGMAGLKTGCSNTTRKLIASTVSTPT